MQVILVRHAEAVEIGSPGARTDFDRSLTARGVEQAAALASALSARGLVVRAVLSSPLVRAMQTATPLLRLLGNGRGEPILNDYLASGELRRRKLSRAVAALNVDAAILVGHNPDLEDYAGWLIGGEPTSLSLEKGAAAAIRFAGPPDRGAGTLEWLVTPGWFMTAKGT